MPYAGPLIDVRAGHHACYDQLVVDSTGPGAVYRVRYVPAVPDQARGDTLALRGGALLEVVIETSAYNLTTDAPTYSPADSSELVTVDSWRTLRQVAWGAAGALAPDQEREPIAYRDQLTPRRDRPGDRRHPGGAAHTRQGQDRAAEHATMPRWTRPATEGPAAGDRRRCPAVMSASWRALDHLGSGQGRPDACCAAR